MTNLDSFLLDVIIGKPYGVIYTQTTEIKVFDLLHEFFDKALWLIPKLIGVFENV